MPPTALVDVAIVFALLEYLVLAWRRRWRRAAMLDLVFAIAPGLCLMVALRLALSGGRTIWTVALLAASLPLHLADLARRSAAAGG